MKKLLVLIVVGASLGATMSSCDHVTKKKPRSLRSDSLIGNLATASLIFDSSVSGHVLVRENQMKQPLGDDSIRVFGAVRPKYKAPSAP